MAEPQVRRRPVLTIGSGRTCEEVRGALSLRGFEARALAAAPGSDEELERAVLASELVLFCAEPGAREDAFARIDRACAAHDRPCLHLAFDRGRILVGPLFVPGRTVCFRCSRIYRGCFEDGRDVGADPPSEPAPWMSALAATAAVDEMAAFGERGEHLRVASCVAIAPYDRLARHRNILETSYVPAMTTCAICDARRPDDALGSGVFIVGSQRSGTTMLGLALDAHEGIEALDEDRAYAAVAEQASESPPVRVYKVPNWTGAVSTFARHFPGAAFLFMKRPVVQIVASMLTLRGFTGASWADLFAAIESRVAMAGFSDAATRAALEQHYRRAQGDPVLLATLCAVAKQALVAEYRRHGLRTLEVDYEQLVRDPRATLAGVLDFIGLPWSDRVLAGHQRSEGTGIGQAERGRAIDAASLDKHLRVLGAEARGKVSRFEASLRGALAGAGE